MTVFHGAWLVFLHLANRFNSIACSKNSFFDIEVILKWKVQVFQLTGHLLYWGRATIIYPVCESNLYVVSHHIPTPLPAKLREKFYDKFSDSLLETLSSFSLPRSVSVSPPLSLHQHRLTEIVIWLLQFHLISQLHTYVTLALDHDITLHDAPSPATGVQHNTESSPQVVEFHL